MDKHEKQMINIVNRNADIKEMERNLRSISARRKKKGTKK